MKRFGYLLVASLALCAGWANSACDEVGYIATFEVTEGQEQAFEQAIAKAAAKVMEVEEGAILYSPYRGDNGKYYMMERYQNLAAREAHAKDPAVTELFGPVMGALSAPVAVESVALVCGEQETL
jgi:quinol monooxygenase YgiN